MDGRTFRDAMGTFPTGVTVITTMFENEVYGMTANALMSVSLSPKLLIISIDENASMLEKLKEAQQFAISILAHHQQAISMHFAGQKKREEEIQFEWLHGLPVIPEALTTIACTVQEVIVAGDHTMFLGHVEQINMSENNLPLTFYRGEYHSLIKSE